MSSKIMAEAVELSPRDVREVNLLTLWALADNCLDDFRVCHVTMDYLCQVVRENSARVQQALRWLRERGIIEFLTDEDTPKWETGSADINVRITEPATWTVR